MILLEELWNWMDLIKLGGSKETVTIYMGTEWRLMRNQNCKDFLKVVREKTKNK